MKVCKLNRLCDFAESSYLLGVGTQSCYNTDKCPYDGFQVDGTPGKFDIQSVGLYNRREAEAMATHSVLKTIKDFADSVDIPELPSCICGDTLIHYRYHRTPEAETNTYTCPTCERMFVNELHFDNDEYEKKSDIKWFPEDSAHADLTKPDSPVIHKTVEVEHWIYCPECGEKSIGNGYGMFKCTDCNDTLYVDGFNL